MGAHHIYISIEDCCLSLDGLYEDDSDQDWSTKSTRFKASCYKTSLMKFKLHIRTTPFLTPDVTYRVSLLFRCSERRKINEHVGVRFQLHGETKISVVRYFSEVSEWLAVELYQFTNQKESIQDYEILLDDCGLSSWLYIEGIEFEPVKKVESPMEVASKGIVRTVVSPLFYNYDEEFKTRLSQRGILLQEGKMFLSLNQNGEHHLMMSIKDYLTGDCCYEFWYIRNSRLLVGCYKTHLKDFKLHLTTPSFLTPDITYMVNLVLHYSERRKIKQHNISVRYQIDGETSMSVVQFEDKKEGEWLVVELFQFTNDTQKIFDYEILFDDCGLTGDSYIEGIEFRPLEKVGSVVLEANEEIARTAEVMVLLSQGILFQQGKMWGSINEKEESHIAISIKACSSLDEFSEIENSRFEVGCCMIKDFKEFKLRVQKPLDLSPNVTYGLNLVVHSGKKEKQKQPYVGVRYKIEGETKISILQYEDKREGNWLVAELYQYTNYMDSTLDLEIWFEDCGHAGDFYIEGIEFRPLEKAENALVEENKDIVTAAVSPLYRKFPKEVKALLTRGILLDKGKMWLSLNEKEEHIVVISIQVYMTGEHCDGLFMENSRVAAACYKTRLMKFKLHVTTPLFLSPGVRYGLNLLIYYSEIEKIKAYKIGIRYKIQGETKVSMLRFEDKELGCNLVAELCQFTNYKDSILDLEILFEDCGLAGDIYIEGVEFRPLGKAVVVANEEIVRAAVPPMVYKFTKRQLLSQVLLFNDGKTLVFINGKGQNIERIGVGACLDGSSQFRFNYSGWPMYNYKDEFKVNVRAEYLSPHVSYTLDIYFKFKIEKEAKEYSPLRYKLDGGETKVHIIYPTHMTEKGWFVASLYQFTSQSTTLHLDIMFEERNTELQVQAIQLNPSKEKVGMEVLEGYEEILNAASPPLVYKSLEDLFEISKQGFHLKGHKKWFSINKNLENCEMISMKDCLIPYEDYSDRFKSHPLSRFPAGFFETNGEAFKTHVKTHFLSQRIKYTIYLVFKSSSIDKKTYVGLKYRLRGETTTSTVYLAYLRKEDGLHMAELFRFTNNGSTFDVEIDFDGHKSIRIEGILFQPLEEVEDQPLVNSDSDNWEENFPNDYEEILKLSKDRVRWTTKKELYSIFCRGLLLDKGEQWFTIDKNEKKCQMLCARASLVSDKRNSTWESSLQSRFGEMLVITADDKFKIWRRIASQDVSPKTRYACYLVYRLPLDQSTFEAPLHVNINNGHAQDAWFVYLTPPNSPVIGQNLDENTWNPLNRHKEEGIPQQRSDGWMEVNVWEFQTQDTKKPTHIHLKLTNLDKKDLSGLMVQGIELRPV